MGKKVSFTPAAIKSGFLVKTPDWYEYEIVKHLEKTASTGSTNHILIFEGRCPGKEMDGVGVSVLFNEAADWVYLPLFTAANGGELPVEGKDYDFDDLVGIRLEAFTKRGENQDGTPRNNLVEYRPAKR